MKVFCGALVAGMLLVTQALAGADHVPGELIVKFSDGKVPRTLDLLQDGRLLGQVQKVFRSSGAALYRFDQAPALAVSMPELAAAIARHPDVAWAEPNFLISIDNSPAKQGRPAAKTVGSTLDDPLLPQLYGLPMIKAPEAWKVTTGSPKVIVGVVDTGIDYTHEDLAANIWNNSGELGQDTAGRDKRSNGLDDDGNGYIDDWRGWDFHNGDNDPFDDHKHGTHVAGTIGAVAGNGKGVVGVAWKVSLVPLKFLSDKGGGSTDNAISAIEYAVAMHIPILNNSWGGTSASQALQDAIAAADKAGILFIAAAGNRGFNTDENPHYPASYSTPNIVSVAAVDSKAALASFSCYGMTTVDLAAPGVGVVSSLPGNAYGPLDGTSMATPHVAGVAALLLAANPAMTHAQLKEKLLRTASPTAALHGKVATGGLLDAASALELDSTAPAPVADLAIHATEVNALVFSFTATGDDGKSGTALRYEVRYAAEKITEANWASAIVGGQTLGITGQPGQALSIRVGDLPLNSTWYFALRAYDNAANASTLSNLVRASTRPTTMLMAVDAEQCQGMCPGFIASGGWTVSQKSSHGGSRSLGMELFGSEAAFATLDTAPIPVPAGKKVFLSFWQAYAFGAPLSNPGHILVSGNGGKTWTEVLTPKGTRRWGSEFVELTQVIGDGQAVLLKFAYMNNYDPKNLTWYIDDLAVFTTAEP